MIETGLAALLGLLLGSFLNVCIHRMPRDESVVWPGSRCPACGHGIASWDNIPLLSFVLLGGRCRHCFARISWRYPLVEAASALLLAMVVMTGGPGLGAVKYGLFALLTLGMIVSDIETRILPDEFTLGGLAAGLALAPVAPAGGGFPGFVFPQAPAWGLGLLDAALGAGLASGSLWAVAAVYNRVRHREGLGFGDVKMVAMIGAFLGVAGAMAAIFLGCVAGTVVGVAWIVTKKKKASEYELPFGTFLGAAALFEAFRAEGLLRWYWGLGPAGFGG